MFQQIDSSVHQLELCGFSGYARVCLRVRFISDAIERCRANLDSGRATVGRQIISVPVNHELVLWLVTIKQVGFRPEITSLTRSKDNFDSEKTSSGDLGKLLLDVMFETQWMLSGL